jgi:hypothetical protein
MINKHKNPYEWTIEHHDHRFWNNFQVDCYLTVIKDRKNPITQHLFMDWSYMQKKCDPMFHRVMAKSQRLGIYDILGLYPEWSTELVAQLYATTWRSGEGFDSTLNFALEGHQFELKITELPTIFSFVGNDFDREPISTERIILDNELAPLYYPGNERNFATNYGILPKCYIFNNIFRNTLTPKRGDRTSICGSTRNLLLAILHDQPLPSISVFFWSELMFALNHETMYAIYASFIHRIINYKTDREFGYDGKHGAYQPHIVRGPVVPPPPSAVDPAGTSAAAPASPPIRAPSAALESSCAAAHRGKKQNVLIWGLKTLISMCCSNDTRICESHQQMSQQLSTLEEHQREMRTSMGFETPEPVIYTPLPPLIVEDPWAWYRDVRGDDKDDDDIEEDSE